MHPTPVTTTPALPVLRTARVLVIGEESTASTEAVRRLSGDDLEVFTADTPEGAASRLRGGPADLVIVMGSMRPIEQLRAAGILFKTCPVIALVDGDAEDRTRALQRGAVDALSVPAFGPELSERTRLALGRRQALADDRHQGIEVPGGLHIIPASQEAHVRGQRVAINRKEFELLLALAREPERVFTKAELLREVWGYSSGGTTRTLDSHACRLRVKLAEVGGQYIVNKWGVGYRLMPLR